ncbi:unnamed protein product [Choristocarpus tenellus]
MTMPRTAVVLGGLFLGLSSTLTGAWVEVADKTSVLSVTASGSDLRTFNDNGCDPAGCIPENTRDGSLDPQSRWSCSIVDLGVDECSITYTFATPQPVAGFRLAFYLGNTREREFNFFAGNVKIGEGVTDTDIVGLQQYSGIERDIFQVAITDTVTIVHGYDFIEDWFSPTEVEILVIDGDELDTSSVGVSATGFDDRTTSGCPGMCLPSNTLDGDFENDASRWSCLNADATGGLCSITYTFPSPQDLNSILVSFYRGDERIRSLDAIINGVSVGVFRSNSFSDANLEEIVVDQSGVTTVELVAFDLGTEWLSIKETKFYVG